MNAPQIVEQYLNESINAYDDNSAELRDTMPDSDDREDLLENSVRIQDRIDVLRELLRRIRNAEEMNDPLGDEPKTVRVSWDFFDHLLNCMANMQVPHEPNSDTIWGTYRQARALLHYGVEPVWPPVPSNPQASGTPGAAPTFGELEACIIVACESLGLPDVGRSVAVSACRSLGIPIPKPVPINR